MTLAEQIQTIANRANGDKRLRLATVIGVSGNTCDVRTIDTDAEIGEVRLQADASNGVLIVPVVGSVVIVAPLYDAEFIVLMYSAVDSIKMLDGSYGGLVKAPELKTQLDKTNEVVNAIVNALTTWTPVANDGGAALKTAATAAIGTKVVGDYSNIENEDITHGTT